MESKIFDYQERVTFNNNLINQRGANDITFNDGYKLPKVYFKMTHARYNLSNEGNT